jgi:hypothetical protein
VGVGVQIYEQFSQAYDASKKLEGALNDLANANVENESVHQLQRDIDEFEKQAEIYKTRGLLERILFGAKEDEDFSHAANLNQVKKDLIETRQLADDVTKAQVRILKASANPEDVKRGEALEKSASDENEKRDLQDKLDDAQKAQDNLIFIRDRIEDTLKNPDQQGPKDIAFARKYNLADIYSQIDSGQKKIDEIKAAQAATGQAEAAETAKANRPEKTEKSKPELAEDRTIDPIQFADGLTQRLVKFEQEQQAREARAAVVLTEQKTRRDELLGNRTTLASDLATAQANAMGFHGQVSSLRREGFGRTPGATHDGAALKAQQESLKRLENMDKQISELNQKIGGSA